MRYLRSILGAVALAAAFALPAAVQAQTTLDFAKERTTYHIWHDDFDNYEVDQWILTTVEAGAGDATEAVADADGGILVVTNDAGANDVDYYNWAGDDATAGAETWTFTTGKRLLFQARFKVSDATQSDLVFGLQVIDTTPLAVANGIWIGKDDGDANLDFHVAASSVQTDVAAWATLADNTYTTLAFYYDGGDNIQLMKDGTVVGTAAITNAPSTELTISFGIKNGEAVAKILSVDYVSVYKER